MYEHVHALSSEVAESAEYLEMKEREEEEERWREWLTKFDAAVEAKR